MHYDFGLALGTAFTVALLTSATLFSVSWTWLMDIETSKGLIGRIHGRLQRGNCHFRPRRRCAVAILSASVAMLCLKSSTAFHNGCCVFTRGRSDFVNASEYMPHPFQSGVAPNYLATPSPPAVTLPKAPPCHFWPDLQRLLWWHAGSALQTRSADANAVFTTESKVSTAVFCAARKDSLLKADTIVSRKFQ